MSRRFRATARWLVAAGGLSVPALGMSLPAAASGASAIVPGSSTQNALAVSVDAANVVARACRAGASCSAAGGEAFAIPAEGNAAKATVETVALAGDKGVAVVQVPLKTGGSWVLLLAASAAGDAPAVQKKLSGAIDVAHGKLDGERYRRVLLREKNAAGTRLVIGKRYENATVCGRPATIAAQELVPADMTWRSTHARSLSAKARAAATAITATRASTGLDTNLPSLLTATVASSAVGQSRSGMTDGDLTTRWAEKRPGDGKGELISMNGSEEVSITGFDIVLRPTGDAAARAAAPRTFFIATQDDVFHVTLPEDAWSAEPGQTYQVTLPQRVKSDCVALVLDEGYVDGERDEVGFAELRARTELDGKTHAELAELLRGDSPHADAARAILVRSGKPAISAVMAAYDKLDRLGKARAVEVVESGSCSETSRFYVDRLLGRGRDLKDFEPELDPLAQRARTQLRGCRGAATEALTQAMKSEAPGKRRVVAARELADIAPMAAVDAILAVLADGSTAPKASGADDVVRRGLRSALGIALKHKRAERVVRERLAPARFAKLSLVERIDLLRALGPRLAELSPIAGPALGGLLDARASFRTRYLLLPAAAHLAGAGDANALAFIDASLTKAKSAHLRARAAAVSGGIPALAKEIAKALDDASPRVREAALAGMTGAGKIPPASEPRVIALLAGDKWTFVRIGAAQALSRQSAGGPADAALIAALDDTSNLVRTAVLRALGDKKTVAAGEAIHDIADNPRESIGVRAAAVAALGSLCRSESNELLYKLALRAGYQQLPYDQPLGLAALAALGEIKPPDIAERLAPLLAKGGQVPRQIRSITRDVLSREGTCK